MNKLAGRIGIGIAVGIIALFAWLIGSSQGSPADDDASPPSTTPSLISSTAPATTTGSGDRPVTSLNSLTESARPPSPLPTGTPNIDQLHQKLQAFVAAYYQILPSDFDTQGNDNGRRQSRILAVTPGQIHKQLAQVIVDPGLEVLYLQYKAAVHGEIDLGRIDVYSVNSAHTFLNIRMPVTIHIDRQDGSQLASLTLSGANEPASDWSYQDGTWTMTRFTP